jgi:hypothetical protein
LNTGYLFNAERALATEEESAAEADQGKNLYPINMDKVFYAGSIIIGEKRKGLVSFEDPTYGLKKQNDKKGKVKAKPKSKTKYVQLAVNDQLGGYTVKEVETDYITFEKGGKSIEKMLHDNNKTRIKPPARKKVVRKKKAPTASTRKKVKLGTPTKKSKTVQSRTVKKPKVIESRRNLSPNPALPRTRRLELPTSK